jgi:predicted nucleic acid-binding protein
MTGTSRERVYLDTNVILDWVSRRLDSGSHSGVGGLIGAICSNQLDAVVSDIARLEVMECKSEPTMWKAWTSLRARRNVQVAGCTRAVMDRAAEIRNHYQGLKDSGVTTKRAPSTPDVIHVATALIFDCQTMYSFDQGRKANDTSPLDMGPLVMAKYPLKIIRPDQGDFSAFNV